MLMLVTCPETGHLEEIEYENHPLGMITTGCSRFCPPCSVNCERTCAARLSRKHRASAEFGDEDDTLVELRL